MKRVVVVGSGVAGVRALETLRKNGYEGRLTLLGAEAEQPYHRPPLSKELLTGDLDESDVRLLGAEQLADLQVELELGAAATVLDPAARMVRTTRGALAYDGLIIATGSEAVRPGGWRAMPGVHTLRTLRDAVAVRAAMAAGSPRVVVIGAGFIGCEVASAARHRELETTIVEAQPVPLQRVLGPVLAEPVARHHADHGVRTTRPAGS
ncbi:MAG: FAD-dependent oxidoreductase [Dehalococcoidia bacterium]